MYLMYNHAEFNNKIYSGYIIFCSYQIYDNKHILCIFTSKKHVYSSVEKPNAFQ